MDRFARGEERNASSSKKRRKGEQEEMEDIMKGWKEEVCGMYLQQRKERAR